MAVKFSNNASTTLASNASNSATSISVADGSVFPVLSGTDYFYVTLETAANTAREIVKCTARSGNTLTIVRAQDGTSASAFAGGDKVELRLTAAVLNDISASAADMSLNAFTGDGSTTAFTLSTAPIEANTLVYLDGVYQNKTAYAVVDQTLTFSAAPASGVSIEITAASIAPIQASSEFIVSTFSGDNSTTVFTLASQATETNTNVYIDGVYQSKSGYSVDGATLTFSAAPPAGVAIEVIAANQIVVSTTIASDGSVTTAKLAANAVTTSKLAVNAVTTAKLEAAFVARVTALEDEIILNLGV